MPGMPPGKTDGFSWYVPPDLLKGLTLFIYVQSKSRLNEQLMLLSYCTISCSSQMPCIETV